MHPIHSKAGTRHGTMRMLQGILQVPHPSAAAARRPGRATRVPLFELRALLASIFEGKDRQSPFGQGVPRPAAHGAGVRGAGGVAQLGHQSRSKRTGRPACLVVG